ncbi:hypothetical protein J007_03817 [Cryptococcus neoformans]|nr:hypothetical protein J007_03817 [Cryptococcus neoformans var. grubii]OXC60644.1 hypothetical protein C358_03911 [Cryptococcus neoformans var. grubii MW-RSA852]
MSYIHTSQTTYHPTMPTFHPSINHIKSVHVSPLARDGYVHLNFFATFNNHDLSSDLTPEHGHWEIWTDIPFLDSQGNPPAYPGEWRSQQFKPFKTFSDEPNGHAASSTDRGSGLMLKPVSLPEPAKLLTTLHLVLVTPAEPNRSYSYTFRYVYPDGQISWQSGVGGNGIVNLKEADTSPDRTKIRSGSSWPPTHNASEDNDSWEWRGIGVTLQQSGERAVKPQIQPLPPQRAVEQTFALLHGPPTPHLSSFSHLSPTRLPIPTKAPTSYLAVIGHPDSPLIQMGLRPMDSHKGKPASYALGVDSSPTEVLREAVKASKGDQSHLIVAEVKEKDSLSKDVGALIYHSGKDEPEKSYLIVDAVHSYHPRDITVIIPESFASTAPLAVISDYSSVPPLYIPNSNSTDISKPREIPIYIQPGAAAEALRLVEFIQLRSSETDNSSVWICAPDGINYEVGEEEIEAEPTNPMENKAYFSMPKDAVTPAVIVPPVDGAHTPQTELAGPDGISSVANHSSKPDDGRWWIFKAISRFFSTIWNFILFPFRSRSTSLIQGAGNDAKSGNNERTPLLDPGLSHPISDTPSTSQGTSSFSDPITPLPHTVTITSYVCFTFDHPAPFQFLLPPASNTLLGNLTFTSKQKAADSWNGLDLRITDTDGGTVRAEAYANEDEKSASTGSSKWLVKIQQSI